MSTFDKRRSLTSEIADETTKKNGFEERRLKRKLKDIERGALKQQRKRNNEQLEYALENLSLEDVDAFSSLTKKILKSNFLPPINQKPRGGTCEDKRGNMDEFLAERLRGSKMIHRYLDKKRKPRMLTRSLSADSGLVPQSVDRPKETEFKPSPYTAGMKRKIVASFSDATYRPVFAGGVAHSSHPFHDARKFDDATGSHDTRRVHFADGENDQLKTTSRPKRTLRNKQPTEYFLRQPKVQHNCLSEAIEYKLKLREKERKLFQESGESST